MAKNNIQQFESIRILGSLLGTKVLEDLRFYKLEGQNPADYGVEKGLKLSDELSRYWRIAQTRWQEYQQQRERTDIPQQQLAIQDWLLPLLEKVLGYQIDAAQIQVIGERQFPITHFAHNGDMPLVLCGADKDLDKGDVQFGQEGRKRSPMGLVQEYLNAESKCLWAIVSNGVYLRLLRDNPAMTRSAYIEVDFARLFEEDNYADFATLWLLLHATRTAPREGSLEKSWLETWRAKGLDEGERIVEKLRFGVADALRQLGTGFVAHPKNTELRQKLDSGELTTDVYFQQVLRLVYRMLFLLTAEDRNIALFTGAEYKAARSLYDKGYSISSLRERARFKRNHDYYGDAWQQLLINFGGFANGQPALAQPALGGLFAESQCPDIDTCELQNRYFHAALYKLCYFEQGHSLARINYRDMNTEEFGSVYEALLELTPQLHTQGQWSFSFQGDAEGEQTASGNARKLSGAYYTPDSLVQELIKSALVPVIEDRLKGKVNQADKRAAILSITVCDPACGSGHFLLGAARRLAAELAQIDADKDQPTDEHYRHALRDVVRHCIYGVDLNPLAIELCKTGLWLESIEPGKPLSFLDHHLKCGNSLLGASKRKIDICIPDDAFKYSQYDDKQVVENLRKKNKRESEDFLSGQIGMFVDDGLENEFYDTALTIEDLQSDSLEEVNIQFHEYMNMTSSENYQHSKFIADLWCAIFIWRKENSELGKICPTENLFRLYKNDYRKVPKAVCDKVNNIARTYKLFHWHIEYPHIFDKRRSVGGLQLGEGFDVIIGNPPWEKLQTEELQFFSDKDNKIASLTGAKRKDAINSLQMSNPSLEQEWLSQKSKDALMINLIRLSGEYPLTGIGKFNTYALFSEQNTKHINDYGRAGFIVPTGIATDDNTKQYFSYICENNTLVSLFDFENRKGIFPSVHRMFKFSLLTIKGIKASSSSAGIYFAFFLEDPSLIDNNKFKLTLQDIKKINPNTGNCPIFRSEEDAELVKYIYDRVPIFLNERNSSESKWGGIAWRLINTTDDSESFLTLGDHSNESLVPLYEAKMIYQFDHRYASYDLNGDNLTYVAEEQKQDINYAVNARHYLLEKYFIERLPSRLSDRKWFLTVRNITNATNERTTIATIIPRSAGCEVTPYVELKGRNAADYLLLAAIFNSYIFDYVSRQKVGGTHLSYFILYQLPTIFPEKIDPSLREKIKSIALELIYTSIDLTDFAKECGYDGEPFIWDADRRLRLMCELNAILFYLYLGNLEWNSSSPTLSEMFKRPVDAIDYVMKTFPITQKKEEKEFGKYLSRDLILSEFNRLVLSKTNGEEYTSLLVPPPGQNADPTYASVGVFRDHEDAQLAGLIWSVMVTGNASQTELRGILEMLRLPQALDAYIPQESLSIAKQLFSDYQLLFSQERIDHADAIISHFKRQTWVRTDSKGIFTVSTHSVPDGIQVNNELTTLAEHLLVAAKASLQSDKQQTGADIETSTKSA